MSFTNSDFLLGVLQELAVLGEGDTAPSAAQGPSALKRLNNMMFEWDGLGIPLEYSAQTNLTDDCPLDESIRQTVAANLAVRLAPMYGKTVSPVTAALATTGFDRLARDAALAAQATQKMDNLPRDSARLNWRGSRILTDG